MNHDEYLEHDATALAERVRNGDIGAEDLLDLALERLGKLNPTLNAVVHRMDDDARAAARATPRGAADAGVFAGVPFLAKDLVSHYAGHPTSAGSRFLAHTPIGWDVELTRRVRATGVSVFGKTNLPEWGLLPTTESDFWGPCRNPWDVERTPGGSSGGSGAAIAAGIVPMAGGGDGGGSIRIPASCCGLFGLKPTRGRTPTGPRRGLLWRGATVEHVLTRSVRDSAAMLDATHGADAGAPFEIPAPRRPYVEEVDANPGRLRIAWTTTPSVPVDVDSSCVSAVHEAVALLEGLGHELVPADLPLDGPVFSKHFLTVIAGELGADIAEASQLVGRRPRRGELEPATRALALLADALSANEFATALRGLEEIGRGIGTFFEDFDVILTPTLSTPPPLLGTIGPSGPAAWSKPPASSIRPRKAFWTSLRSPRSSTRPGTPPCPSPSTGRTWGSPSASTSSDTSPGKTSSSDSRASWSVLSPGSIGYPSSRDRSADAGQAGRLADVPPAPGFYPRVTQRGG